MSAKKAAKKTAVKLVTITMGIHKDKKATVTRKKAPAGCAVLNVNGVDVTINKMFYK